jgi:3-mercaptopyruvate sulfurtransferase SseA
MIVPAVQPAKVPAVPALVDTAWCLDHLDDPGVRFVEVDERPDRRRYELGHIPGAVSWNWNLQLCRIGERSSHTWFVLHELLGYERVRNYDGSWTEWGSSVGVPIER